MYRTTQPPPAVVYPLPSTVEEIMADINGRRSAFLRAFFVDADIVFGLCKPEYENLCLYAYPNETWDVSLDSEEVPPELPEPVLGINFSRDLMTRHAWFQFVALHSDSWLLRLAFFFGCQLSHAERSRLFDLFDDRPTLHERVTNHPQN